MYSVPLQKKALHIILVHNHPSGNLKPSELDIDVTGRLVQIGLMMNTPVLDHLIISEHSYYSFKAVGIIEDLKLSGQYLPSFELENRFSDEMFAREKKNRKLQLSAEKTGKKEEKKE